MSGRTISLYGIRMMHMNDNEWHFSFFFLFFFTSLRRIKMSAKLGWLSLLACSFFFVFGGRLRTLCTSNMWVYDLGLLARCIPNDDLLEKMANDLERDSVSCVCRGQNFVISRRIMFTCFFCWCCCIRFITGELINIFVIFVCVLFLWKNMQAKFQIMEKKNVCQRIMMLPLYVLSADAGLFGRKPVLHEQFLYEDIVNLIIESIPSSRVSCFNYALAWNTCHLRQFKVNSKCMYFFYASHF